jgi:hypothetical protein
MQDYYLWITWYAPQSNADAKLLPKLGTPLGLRMAVLPTGKGTRGYPTLLGKGTGIEFYPRVRVRV